MTSPCQNPILARLLGAACSLGVDAVPYAVYAQAASDPENTADVSNDEATSEDAPTEAAETDANASEPAAGEAPADQATDVDTDAVARGTNAQQEAAIPQIIAPADATPNRFQLLLPPFLREESATVTTTIFFPFLHLRESRELDLEGHVTGGTSELFIPPVYHREGASNGDVVFPLFWWFRDRQGPHNDLVIPPFYTFNNASGHHTGVAPFFFTGRHHAGDGEHATHSYYDLAPLVLTGFWGDDTTHNWISLLAYRFQNRDDERFGLFPLAWFRNGDRERYQAIAPLFLRHQNEERTLTVAPLGLFYLLEKPEESFVGIAGLFHHNQGPGHHSTTLPFLLTHYSVAQNTFRLGTPLFLYMNENGTSTFASWLYQRYRGVTEFDGVVPLFARYRDPRVGSHLTMASPLVWWWGDPGNSNFMTPLVGQFHRHGLSRTTWVFPTVQVSEWTTGSAFNIHPLIYYENVRDHRHIVAAPIWWDFENFTGRERTRTTFVFPFAYYRHVNVPTEHRWEWEVHVLGLYDRYENSAGDWRWRVLYGLAGHEHRRDYDRDMVLWANIDHRHPAVTDDDEADDAADEEPALEEEEGNSDTRTSDDSD